MCRDRRRDGGRACGESACVIMLVAVDESRISPFFSVVSFAFWRLGGRFGGACWLLDGSGKIPI